MDSVSEAFYRLGTALIYVACFGALAYMLLG
jgi:hypothetical protein